MPAVKNFLFLAACLFSATVFAQTQQLKEGDIIFQSNISPQCKAIELATHSRYSHCGILFKQDGRWMVFEAVQPVSIATFEEWTMRNNKHYAVKRLKTDSVITPEVISKMKEDGKQFLGKDYDSYFEWSDDRIYCSELVWKIYRSTTGIELGSPKPMREYDLSHPLVKSTMKERYGNNIPLDEKMVSPGVIYESPLLVTIVEQ
ncbi:YiiX family permuted papain-like enzyme [Chitinophaga sp. GCM10012297]|uniref:YiiX family permuted papain-like enzyme n=1 Tax=Chitinophaga chungangae TaxID=2821488 RepID=A0ABS3YDZ2_9BACT|nr:YiiX family permuted papain-like enzyme [Chitinophaga chungangae]MBO9152907.1 YiiX family permuted papain-like enzyme [Chitinophaga chungangae]